MSILHTFARHERKTTAKQQHKKRRTGHPKEKIDNGSYSQTKYQQAAAEENV